MPTASWQIVIETKFCHYTSLCGCSMAIWVVSFQAGGVKLKRILPENQHIQRIFLNFEHWTIVLPLFLVPKLRSVAQNDLIHPSFSIFYTKKIKIINLKNQTFASFWVSQLVQFSKFKKFLWVCWFLGKNLSNFIPPTWKQPILP